MALSHRSRPTLAVCHTGTGSTRAGTPCKARSVRAARPSSAISRAPAPSLCMQQRGVAPAGMGVGGEQGAKALALVDGAGIGEAQRAARAHRAARAAAHAQVRLDDDAAAGGSDHGVVGAAVALLARRLALQRGIAADGARGTHVDAGTAADLLVAAVRTQLGLIVKELGLFELSGQLAQGQHRFHERALVASSGHVEVALRRLVHREGRLLTQVQHKVEPLGHGSAARAGSRWRLPPRTPARNRGGSCRPTGRPGS